VTLFHHYTFSMHGMGIGSMGESAMKGQWSWMEV